MRLLLLFLSILVLCGCRSTQETLRYPAAKGPFAPVLVGEGSQDRHNRVGTVRDGWVDANTPTMYHQRQDFRTAKGQYHNDIYRFHFERIPFGHLSWGRNVGLFVIVTSNAQNQPLLVTTVHTCGCYSAIVPTSLLSEDMLPKTWLGLPQPIYGEKLPALLTIPDDPASWHPEIHIRADSHRVRDIRSTAAGDETMLTQTMQSLVDAGFYHQKGPLKGYVKNSHKLLEQILMWWTLDPFIGSDKRLGPQEQVGAQFYTSIRFWMREESDMWNFGNWLAEQGWRL